MPIQINVSVDHNNVYTYSVGKHDPLHNLFTHHFVVGDQITWQGKQRVEIAFASDKVCPFVNADDTPWTDNKAIFPGQPAKLNPKFGRDRYYLPVKYTVSLPDSPKTKPHDPEVIVVDGGD